MNASPLQLEHYFFAETRCKASPKPPELTSAPLTPVDADQFSTELKIFKGETDPNYYQLQLVVKTTDEGALQAAYELLLHVIGYFRVDPDFEHDRIEHLVQINGASVLYSAARDFVLTLTSRGPWGPLMLPTVNFRIGHSKPADTVSDGD